jgi:hypothetical protein
MVPGKRIDAIPMILPPGKPGASGTDLEKRLDAILRELEELRQEMRAKPRAPGVKPPTKLDTKPDDEIRLKLENALKVAEELQKKKLDLEARTAEALVPLRLETEALRDQLRFTDRESEDAHARLKALEAEFEAALSKVKNEQARPELERRFKEQRDVAQVRAEEAKRVRTQLREKSEMLKLKSDAIARDRDAALRKIEQELKIAEEAAGRAREALDQLPSRP